MWSRVVDHLTTMFCIMIVVIPSAIIWKNNIEHNFMKVAVTAQGTTLAFNAGLLFTNFDKPIINSCGDTEIYGFLDHPDGITLQLKPLFIPEAKAEDFVNDNGQVIVFPLWDIMALLTEGIYNIELFVKNTCGIGEKAIELKPFILEIKNETTNSTFASPTERMSKPEWISY